MDIIRHRRRNDPRVVAHSTHLMTTNFNCQRPELWSALPSNIKERKSVASFKRQLKHLHKSLCKLNS